MATYTANHMHASVILECSSGPWLGETAAWGWDFGCHGSIGDARPNLDRGNIVLTQFSVVTDNASRTLTAGTKAGTVAGAWVGASSPVQGQITSNDIDFFFNTLATFYGTATGFMPNSWRLRHIKLYATGADGKSPSGPNTWTPSAAWAGAQSDGPSPEVALCLSRYSADRSRRGRGRVFIGPLGGNFTNASGTLTTTITGLLGVAEQTVQSTVRTRGTVGTSATYVGIVYNRKGGKDNRAGDTGAVINRIRVGDEADHQERRTKGRPEVFTDQVVT